MAIGPPMNIVPPPMQQAMAAPMGILNGQPNPQGTGNQSLMQMAQGMMQQPQMPSQLQPIQMARPLGTQGIDPMKLLAAMKQNALMNP